MMNPKRVCIFGPISAHHGESKMLRYSIEALSEHFNVISYDTLNCRLRLIRPFYVGYLVLNATLTKKPNLIYLSISRNKFSLLITLPLITIAKFFDPLPIIFHVHDTELRRNTRGLFGFFIKKMYTFCISSTVVPNRTLEEYSRLDLSMIMDYILNPYLGRADCFPINKKTEYYHFVSFPSENKRLDLAIKISNIKNIKLRVIGWKKTDFNRIYYKKNYSMENIEFLGALGHLAAIEELKSSAGLLALSEREAMPLTIVEALLVGIPIYTRDQSGYRFFINNFDTVKKISCDKEPIEKPNAYRLRLNQKKASGLFSKLSYKKYFVGIINKYL